MPDPLTQRLYEVLSADATIAAQVSPYAGVPAVFTVDPVPEDADFPYLWIRGSSLSSDASALTGEMRDFSRDIVVVAERTGDPVQIDNIAWRIQEIFRDKHGQALSGGGLGGMPDPEGGSWYPITVNVNGPVEASNDEDSYGRSIELSLTMERF